MPATDRPSGGCRFGDDWKLGLPLLVLFLLVAICLVLVFGRLLTRTAME